MKSSLKKLLNKKSYSRNFPFVAEIYRKKEEYDLAEKICLSGIKKNPKFCRAYNVLGRIYFDQGKYKKAQEVFEKALNFEPQNWFTLRHLGKIYIHLKNIPQALEIYKTILLFYPHFDQAQEILTQLENISQEKYQQFSAQSLNQVAADLSQDEFFQRPSIQPTHKQTSGHLNSPQKVLKEMSRPPEPLTSFPHTASYRKNQRIHKLKKLMEKLSSRG